MTVARLLEVLLLLITPLKQKGYGSYFIANVYGGGRQWDFFA